MICPNLTLARKCEQLAVLTGAKKLIAFTGNHWTSSPCKFRSYNVPGYRVLRATIGKEVDNGDIEFSFSEFKKFRMNILSEVAAWIVDPFSSS